LHSRRLMLYLPSAARSASQPSAWKPTNGNNKQQHRGQVQHINHQLAGQLLTADTKQCSRHKVAIEIMWKLDVIDLLRDEADAVTALWGAVPFVHLAQHALRWPEQRRTRSRSLILERSQTVWHAFLCRVVLIPLRSHPSDIQQ
jgi:hypothetical protein